MNIHMYNDWGSWITTFNSPLTLCLPYTDSDPAMAGGTPNSLIIQTAPIGGAWSALATTVDAINRVCANADHLTLFDISVRVSGGPSATYTVRQGDTLFRIALRFNTTVAALQAVNGLTSSAIYPGQVLVIPGSVLSSNQLPLSPTLRADPIAPGRYIVQEGDTLYRIALRAGTTVRTLQVVNGLTSTYIRVGQELIIPESSVVSSPTMTPIPSHPATCIVRPGDNLFRIALRYGTTVTALMEANGLTTTRIDIGQVLIIPGP
jgi:LysM repeat protein